MKKFKIMIVVIATVGLFSFESSNRLSRSEFLARQGVFATMPADFEFDFKWEVVSYEWLYRPKNGDLVSGKAIGSKYSDQLTTLIKSSNPNDIFLIENVIILGSNGEKRKMQGLSVVIK